MLTFREGEREREGEEWERNERVLHIFFLLNFNLGYCKFPFCLHFVSILSLDAVMTCKGGSVCVRDCGERQHWRKREKRGERENKRNKESEGEKK